MRFVYYNNSGLGAVHDKSNYLKIGLFNVQFNLSIR